MDLPGQQDKPEGRQMLASLIAYMGSEAFHPAQQVSLELMACLFPEPLVHMAQGFAASLTGKAAAALPELEGGWPLPVLIPYVGAFVRYASRLGVEFTVFAGKSLGHVRAVPSGGWLEIKTLETDSHARSNQAFTLTLSFREYRVNHLRA